MTLLLLPFIKRHGSYYPNPRQPLISFHTQQPKSHPNISTIKTLVQGGHFIQALQHYTNLWNNGHKPDNFTFPYILKASSQLPHPTIGLSIHSHAIKTGFHTNLFVGNSLILFYARFGHLDTMHQLFDEIPQKNIVTWTAIISAYSQNGQFSYAIELFHGMLVADVRPNSFTMAVILGGLCCNQGAMQIHGFMIKCGFESDVIISTALIDSYAKCGNTKFACRCFSEMTQRNLVSWNAMISGFNRSGNAQAALELFVEMQESNTIQPDTFTIVAILGSSSCLASLRQGKEIHGYVYRANMEHEIFVTNGLIDMYGKCGDVEKAQRVFDNMQKRDVGSWTALINCYGLHGHGTRAIAVFEKMKQTPSVTPNYVTFTAILSACSHACLLQDGLRYFRTMSTDFSIDPTMKHYACIVDMLGRAGHLMEALKFISEMPIQPDSRVWEALLGAASIRGDRIATEIAVKQLLELEPENSVELHVQLSSIYAKAGKWDDVAKIRGRMRSKSPGVSWIQTLRKKQLWCAGMIRIHSQRISNSRSVKHRCQKEDHESITSFDEWKEPFALGNKQ